MVLRFSILNVLSLSSGAEALSASESLKWLKIYFNFGKVSALSYTIHIRHRELIPMTSKLLFTRSASSFRVCVVR